MAAFRRKNLQAMSNPLSALQPEEGWEEILNPYQLGSGYSFRAEQPLVNGTYTRLFRSRDWTVGWVYFGKGAAGPPQFAHGGTQACILDDVMGATVWAHGFPAVAAELKMSFEHMSVRLETPLVVECYIEEKSSGRAQLWAGIRGEDGVVATEAEGEFARLPLERLRTFFVENNYPLDEFESYVERHGLSQ